MKTYEQVDTYMQQIGLKYVKSSNEFVAGLAIRTNKDYTQKVAAELNSRAQHSNSSNMVFYKIKNETFDGSIYISAAFDGGLFRHLGNLIIDNSELFDGKEAVDFACDCGIVTCFIAKMYPNCHITGVDVNSSAIENANILKDKLGLDNVDFVCSDVFEYNNEKKADTAVTFRALLDVKYSAVIGMIMYIGCYLQVMMIVGILVLAVYIILKATKRGGMKTLIPMGPFISASTVISMCFPVLNSLVVLENMF